ncbi:MAG: VCBS repeat-containing protein, partial [Phycisphaera sp.]|nr:VCBS repeat-containing protein [Phycisphaera sp.]
MPMLPIILVLIATAPPGPPTSPIRDAPEIHPDYEHIVVSKDSDFEACGVADFDRDGDLDIVCGDAWYESPSWTRRPIGLIRSVGGYRVDFADVPMDVDGDGWIDVVS